MRTCFSPSCVDVESCVDVWNFPIAHVTSAKPKNTNLEPPAPVRIVCDLANFLLVFILSH